MINSNNTTYGWKPQFAKSCLLARSFDYPTANGIIRARNYRPPEPYFTSILQYSVYIFFLAVLACVAFNKTFFYKVGRTNGLLLGHGKGEIGYIV